MRLPLSSHGFRGATRSTSHSRALLRGLLTAALAATLTASLQAATYVVATDASGDFTSIQTAIDTAYARRPQNVSSPPDTVIVRAGYYDEVIQTHDDAHDLIVVVIGVDGPLATRVRGIAFTPVRYYSGYPAQVRQLGFVERVRTGDYAATYHFVGCRFEGGYDMTGHSLSTGYAGGTLVDCEFLDTTRIVVPDYGELPGSPLRGLRFRGPRTEVMTGCVGSGALVDCTFEGPSDTLVFVSVICELEAKFIGCVFRNADVAIARSPSGSLGSYYNVVVLRGCRFEDIAGAAIVAAVPAGLERRPGVEVFRSRFVRCGRALDWGAGSGFVRMRADTIEATAHEAIRAASHSIDLDSLVFTAGSGGIATRLHPIPSIPFGDPGRALRISHSRWENTPGHAIAVVDTSSVSATVRFEIEGNDIRGAGGMGIRLQSPRAKVRGNVVAGSAGDGIWLQPILPSEPFVVDSNTSVSNAGDGIRFVGPYTSAARVFQHNLVARNAGAGLRVGSGFVGSVAFNDAWQNYLGDYAQVDSPLDSNLVADPRFCDLAAGDLTLQFGSPCGAAGPYGQIGALPEACPTIVDAPIAGAAVAFAIHPNPARGEVLFTPPASGGGGALEIVDIAGRRVWSQSFGAGGALIRWRGEAPGGAVGAGLYWVRMTRAEGVTSRRLVWLR